MKPGPSWHGLLAWPAVGLALGLPTLLAGWVPLDQAHTLWPGWAQLMALHPDAGWHQPLRAWWAAAWLHGSAAHWQHNLQALGLLTLLGAILRAPPRTALAWLLAWPLTHVGMLLHHPLHTYIGLSGVLHAGAAILAWHGLTVRKWPNLPTQLPAGILLATLILKILMENPWHNSLIRPAGSDINVAPWAHLSGVVAGSVMFLFTSVTALTANVKRRTQPPRTLD